MSENPGKYDQFHLNSKWRQKEENQQIVTII